MRLIPSDPDVETIVGRIKGNHIDLQPDFQRGEVWSQVKQKRLIDSILRDWHVPPIHVVQHAQTKRQEVLDGQQRLVAIRDFVNGAFTVDGTIEPIDPNIEKLDGLRFAELPTEWLRQFNQFSIRFFLIVDFEPEEPAELFFRLNQPVALTSAEQRNAFFGPIRTQVKELVEDLSSVHFGFSNSRMALDDVIARVCLCIENKTITQKVTSPQLADRYRARTPFDDHAMARCKTAVRFFAMSASQWNQSIKLNKATLFSWLWLSACAAPHFESDTPAVLAQTMALVEHYRKHKFDDVTEKLHLGGTCYLEGRRFASFLRLYLDRSSSRVSDVSSVVARDVFLWIIVAISSSAMLGSNRNNILPLHLLETSLPQFMTGDEDDSAVLMINALIELGVWGSLT